jgi:7-carboxy-7-deazaguanine synthase
MKQRNKLRVSELFYSIQGEGPTTGKPAYFLRLTGCNLMCGGWGTQNDKQLHDNATWRCDSVEVWLRGDLLSFEQVHARLEALGFTSGDRLIITGGEPMMQQDDIIAFIRFLKVDKKLNFLRIEIETNGTIAPRFELDMQVTQYNVSAKLANSGMSEKERIKPAALQALAVNVNTVFKFVVSSIDDLIEIQSTFINPFTIPANNVWLMPAADNREKLNALLPQVAEWCKTFKYSLSNRLHIEIWNEKTGV